jgi:hypothetical protein
MVVENKVHRYLLGYCIVAVENTPVLLEKLLGGISADDPIWNYQPSTDRFTLREAIAHLADWNDIYAERLNRTLKEDNPDLPNCDEGQIAIDHNYAASNPVESLSRFVRTRKDLIELMQGISENDWDRMAVRVGLGPVRLDQQAAIIMGHDAYHIKQVMEYLAANQR